MRKSFCVIILFYLILACGESKPKNLYSAINKRINDITGAGLQGMSKSGNKTNSFSIKKPKTVSLKDAHVKAYIKFSQALFKKQSKLLEQIQSLVPLDVSGMIGTIKKSGFSDIEEFADTNLVLAICVNAILSAENTDRIQGKSKQDYINDFTKDLDPNDEFDRKFKAEAEKRLNKSLSKLEKKGLVGNKTNQMVRFVIRDLKKKKVGKRNTEMALKYLDKLKKVWVLRYPK